MLGFSRLRRRYRRFRYNNQARFPRLFVILDMAKLPLQILLVALPLWLAVGFYDDHFSYRAKNELRNAAIPVVDTLPNMADPSITVANTTDPKIADNENASDTVPEDGVIAINRNAGEAQSVDRGSATDSLIVVKREPAPQNVLLSDIETVGDVQSAELTDKATELNSVVERISGPAQIHIDRLTKEAGPLVLRDAGWLKDQSDTSFVIQVESSANVERMRQQIKKLRSPEQLAIYPYKVSVDGDVVYGLSYGLYETLTDAKNANATMPAEMRRFGSWIRQVGPLKRQIDEIGEPIARR